MSDRLFGVIVIVVALGFIASATQIQTGFMVDPVGPKSFPIGVGIVAALCALAVIIKPDDEPEWPPLKTFVSLLIATVTLVGYAFSLKSLGFIIPTALASGILSYQISPNVLKATLTGIILPFVLFSVFKFMLGLGLVAWPKALVG